MGSLYKTASANPLEYMYKVNAPLMEKVLLANDKYIDGSLAMAGKLEESATSFDYLEPDTKRAKEISDNYSKKIQEISKSIQADPANWRKFTTPISNISRELQSSYKTGEISKITANHKKYKDVSDYLDKAVEQYNKDGKGIDADTANKYKQYFLKKFTDANPNGTAYNPETGEYNTMSAYNPMNNIDIQKTLGDELDKIKADSSKYRKDSVTGEEKYFNERTQNWEGVTPEKILNIVTDRLNNPQLQNYLRERSNVGIMSNVFGEDGKFISPYEYKPIPATPEEQKNIATLKDKLAKTKDAKTKGQIQEVLDNYTAQIEERKQLDWNDENSMLAPIMRGLVTQHSYGKTEEANKLRNNSVWNTKFTQAQTNARHSSTLAQQLKLAQDREAGVQKRFEETMAFRREQEANKNNKDGKKGAKTTELPIESSVTNIRTNSFESWTTTDDNGNTVKVLSNEGLKADLKNKNLQLIDVSRKVIDLSRKMEGVLAGRKVSDLKPHEVIAYNNLKIQRDEAGKSMEVIKSERDSRITWNKVAEDEALNNNISTRKNSKGEVAEALSEEEIKIYRAGTKQLTQNFEDAKAIAKKYEEIYSKTPMSTSLSALDNKLKSLGYTVKKSGSAGKGFKVELSKLTDDGYSYVRDTPEMRYAEVKKKVDDRKENFLAQMRYTPINSEAVNLGKEDSQAIGSMLFANTQGLRIFDATGNPTDKIELEGNGIKLFNSTADNFTFNFNQNDKSLQAYMVKNKVTYVVEQVGNTTKLGSGNALAKITFTDNSGQIKSSPYYIEMTPELQQQVAKRLSVNKNPTVQGVATKLSNVEAQGIRNQLITPSASRTAGATGAIDPVTKLLTIDKGNQRINFNVTTFTSGDGDVDHLLITGPDGMPLGQDEPELLPPSKVAGWFNGIDEAVQYFLQKK